MGADRAGMTYKIVIIGDGGAGKSTLCKRFSTGLFQPGLRTTVGVEFTTRAMVVDGNNVTLRFFDIAGQETARVGSRAYYQGAVGAFVVIDASNPQSIDASLRWKKDLDEKTCNSRFCQQEALAGSGTDLPPFTGTHRRVLPCYLLLNKCDLGVQCGLSKSQLQQLCQRHGFAGYMETSAVAGTNIEEAQDALVRVMQIAAEKAARMPAPVPVVAAQTHALRGPQEESGCSKC